MTHQPSRFSREISASTKALIAYSSSPVPDLLAAIVVFGFILGMALL